MDTYFSYYDKSRGFFSSDERMWINRIRKLQKQYPDKVTVIAEPETNDGCIYVTLPTEWMKIQPPRKSSMTDEQKQAASARLKALRKHQTEST